MSLTRAWVAKGPKEKLVPYEFDMGSLGSNEVEIAVDYCGICHSDLSILNNEWGISMYPVIPGHEVVGKIVAVGQHVKGLKIGQTVGVGWNAGSCMYCHQCISGNQQFCPAIAPTIIGHTGGFADRLRAQQQWVFPLPEKLDAVAAGPLLCGGITVFSPLAIHQIKPTAHVGILGLGGLGHLGVKFAKAWGCEVTVFTHSESKFEDAKKLGADHVFSSVDSEAIKGLANQFDLILVTVNVPLDWPVWVAALAPRGCLHLVGAVLQPIPVSAFALIAGQRQVAGSPTGSPAMIADMLEFAARKGINPQVEHFPMSRVNEALQYLSEGKPRYRVVLDADFD